MSQIQYVDELIREYLLYRCFSNTLKVFDAELKVDKDRGFRVDKIVDQLMQHISAHDLVALRELWGHLDQKIFTKLEHNFTPALRKLENAVLKLYVVNCVVNGKQDKATEFFTKMTSELQGQLEWKEWFMLPFIKNPEENASFAVHFSRQWQDTLLVSLHNFLATIFQCMPQPTLSSFEEDAARIKRLHEENEILKSRIASLIDNPRSNVGEIITPEQVQPAELMDDFYVIAQGSSDISAKSYKTLIRSIGLPSSPTTTRRSSQSKTKSVEEAPQRRSSSKHRIGSTPSWSGNKPSNSGSEVKRDVSSSRTRDPSVEPDLSTKKEFTITSTPVVDNKAFLLLGQEEYGEHRWPVSGLRFNSTGTAVVSADADGVIKLWTTTPTPKTVATFASKASVLSLDWVTKNERYFIGGSKMGLVRLYDTKDNRVTWELGSDPASPLHNAKVINICCNPTESTFICSVINSQGLGKLLLYDIKTRKVERNISLGSNSGVHANCCRFNHNGQLLITGCNDGTIRVYDLRRESCIETSPAHQGSVLSIQLTADDTSCYSLGQDGKLCQRSLYQSGPPAWEVALPDGAMWHGLTSPHGQLFTFGTTGSHVLIGGPNSGNIYEVTSNGLNHLLDLGGHSSSVLAVDWTISNQCATCITASVDGKIKVSTLLTP